MRICFTSDFHGDPARYQELGRLLRDARPDLVILGGDMFADGADPDPAGDQAATAQRLLTEQIAAWRRDLPALAVGCLTGNHDWLATEAALRRLEDAGLLRLLDPTRPWHLGGLTLLGFPYTPPTPHWLKDYERLDLPGDELIDFGLPELWATGPDGPGVVDEAEYFYSRSALEQMLAELPTPSGPWILIAHAPPHDSALDRLPGVEHPIGSRAVRRFIAERRPTAALHGHVHESPEVTGRFVDTIAGVPCINPGQSHERLYAVVFDSDDISGSVRHTEL